MIKPARPGKPPPQENSPYAVLAYDVGGTKTKVMAFLRSDEGVVARRPIYENISRTQTSVPGFFEGIRREFDAARKICTIDEVVVGFPGSCGPDGRILPGTAFNMSPDFAGVDLPGSLKERLPEITRATALNDNTANFIAILDAASTGLWGKTIGYLAPGTGLGAGFARVSEDGRMCLVTDCQLSNMMVALPPEHIRFLEERNRYLPDGKKIGIVNGEAMAEDIFSGRALRAISGAGGEDCPVKGGVLDHRALTPEQATCIRMMGEIVATIVMDVRNRNVRKVAGHPQWPPGDQKDASEASVYFISGGVGHSPVGRAIIGHAMRILSRHDHVKDIAFVHEKNSACYGGAIARRYAPAMRGHIFTCES
jgi:hypothetical protein